MPLRFRQKIQKLLRAREVREKGKGIRDKGKENLIPYHLPLTTKIKDVRKCLKTKKLS